MIVFARSAWLAPCLAGLAGLALFLVWSWRRAPVEGWVRVVCGLLKFAGLAALALCLLEPLRVTQRARRGANVFAVVADNSQSMALRDPGAKLTRGESLRRELVDDPAGWVGDLEREFQVRRYLFDSRLQGSADFHDLTFAGPASALGAALRAGVERWRGQAVAGVLLFSDGNATDLGGELPPLDGCPPIYPVVTGGDEGLRDVSLAKLAVNQTAFEDAPVTVQAAVSAIGFDGENLRTVVNEIGYVPTASGLSNTLTMPAVLTNQVAAAARRIDGAAAELAFRFPLQPGKAGLHYYEVESRLASEAGRPAEGSQEATLVNNRRLFVVDRGREIFRVLCVAGRPDWEYKFLNRALGDEPQVRMVTLLRIARREPKFEFKGRSGEAANPLFRGFGDTNEEAIRYDQPVMIRLNTSDGFELRGGFPQSAADLFAYDAVVFDRLEAGFLTHEQMLLLRRFVAERGGGFLMLGGAESFREGGYDRTAIAPMLPVYLDRPADVKLPALLKWDLTREGWLEPWVRLRATETEERERIAGMPPFQVLNPIRECKPGASLLATVTDGDNHSYPALAVQKFGLGTVATMMVGDLWRWGLASEAAEKDLAKSWRQLIRRLVSDVPTRVGIEVQPASDPAQFRLVVKARDEEYKPLDNATARLTIRPVGAAPGPRAAPGTAEAALEIDADPSATEAGRYEAAYVARASGGYAVEAVVTTSDGRFGGRAQAGWVADPAVEEFRSLKPNRGLLESLARRTGGAVIPLDRLKAFVKQLPDRHAPITDTVAEPLWRKAEIFLFVLACCLAEWGLRRRKGLA